MPFSVAELENISNAILDYHMTNPQVRSQTLQNKPLLQAMTKAEKSFPGGKEEITVGVKGVYTTTIQGFSHDDTVTYSNPANIRRARYPWKLVHSGIKVTLHELAKSGISIANTTNGTGERRHSENEKVVLADLLTDKVEDMMEGTDRGMNLMFWRDGTQDSELVPGVRSFILDDPTSASVVGGIDQSANTWWRNRASLSLSTTTPSDLTIAKKLQSEWRQLRRYGGNPTLWLAGSDFIEALEAELFSKGNFTLEGWTAKKNTDSGMADLSFKGNMIQYDPTLDDEGLDKYLYVIDPRRLYPKVIQGEARKKHNPARPADKYVIYRAQTWMGGLCCDQRNAHGVYSIA